LPRLVMVRASDIALAFLLMSAAQNEDTARGLPYRLSTRRRPAALLRGETEGLAAIQEIRKRNARGRFTPQFENE